MTCTSSTTWRWLAVLGSTVWLLGCGGGGDDGTTIPANNTAGTTGATTPATNSNSNSNSNSNTTTATTLSTCGLPDFAATALARINQYRAAGAQCGTQGSFAATTPLVWNNRLTQAADGHARDMAANNYFSHTSQDGRTLSQRIDAVAYAWSTIGENIAAGQSTVNSVVDGWMASDGHCANLMNPRFVHIGLACASGSSATTYSSYWTLDLAAPP